MNISLSISDDLAAGEYPIQLKNIELTTTANEEIDPSNCSSILTIVDLPLGDANDDGKVSITDAVTVVNYILGTQQGKFSEVAADVDGSGNITITDAVGIVNIILNSNSAGVKERREREEMETYRDPD